MAVPPGSRAPALVQSLRFLRDPGGFLRRSHERYGEIFTVRFIGGESAVYVCDPGLIREAFATDRAGGSAGKARARLLAPLVGSHSLLTLDGEGWERQRKLLGPAFHGDNISRYEGEIREIAAAEISSWGAGEKVELRPRMQAITLEVILRVVFGVRDAERQRRLRELLPELAAAAARMVWLPPSMHRLGERLQARGGPLRRLSPARRFFALRGEVDEILFDEIARRRTDPALGERIDVLSWLIRARDDAGEGLTDLELRDELIGLLEAGHETTATSLAWAFERTLRTPHALAALTDELRSGGPGHYTEALSRETLRTRPVVFDVARVLDEPLDLAGYEIPAGWYLSPAIIVAHQRGDAWAEPEEFRPERFLEGDVEQGRWLPFGGGRRRCVGAQLAMLEMRAVIDEVMQRVELEEIEGPGEVAKLAHVTLVPADGAIVRVREIREAVPA